MKEFVSLPELILAYYDCRKNKRNSKNQLEFEVSYEENLYQLYKELNNYTYLIGKSITFVVTRPKYREVFAADFRDRIVHHLLINKIGYLFEEHFIEDNYNCRKNKGVLYGVNRLHDKIKEYTHNYTTNAYVMKCDIKGFFMHINKTILYKRLHKFLKKYYKKDDLTSVLWLCKKVIFHCPEKNCEIRGDKSLWRFIADDKSLFKNGDNFGLPIGNLTSLIFANFYLHELDIALNIMFNGFYGRYVDDFYCISNNKLKLLNSLEYIRTYLHDNLGLTLHPDKLYLLDYRKGVTFIGSVIKKDRIYTGNKTIGNCYNRILQYIHNKINIYKLVTSINSYFGFMTHTYSYNKRLMLLSKLPETVLYFIDIDPSNKKINLKQQFRQRYKILIKLILKYDYCYAEKRKLHSKRETTKSLDCTLGFSTIC